MKISDDKVVLIHYTLKNEKGEQLDSSIGEEPLGYIHGHKSIVPGLEAELDGREKGEKIAAVIPPEKAYGARDESLIENVPIDQFDDASQLKPGTNLQVKSPEGIRIVTVAEVLENVVRVDFNHPLADQTLHFDVEIVDVRDATAKELEHGRVGSCGCGDSNCES